MKKAITSSMRTRKNIRLTLSYVILIIISIFWLIPFIYLLAQSFSVDTMNYSVFFPDEWTFNNYVLLFTDPAKPFWKWWLNTFIVAGVTCIIQTLITLATSYAFSRLRFKSRRFIMKTFLIIGMFPSFLTMIINYFLLDLIGLNNSIFGLVVIYCASSAMSYYIAKGFFDTVPKSLDEAAMIDGANKNTIFFKIILPLSKPIVVYTVLMAFTGPWGDFMMASYIAQGNNDLMNVAVGLQNLAQVGEVSKYFSRFCAGGVVTSIPIMILFFWLQRYYVEGVTGGAVKG